MYLGEIVTLMENKVSPKLFKLNSEVYGIQYGQANTKKLVKKLMFTVDLSLEAIHFAVKNKINLIDHRQIFGFKDYLPILYNKIDDFIKKKKEMIIPELDEENKKNMLEEYEKLENYIKYFETGLINSIQISYEGEKPFYLADIPRTTVIHNIQKLIINFIFAPEIFSNLNSLSDFNFTFKISFGNDLDKKISCYEDFNFLEFKEKIIDNFWIFYEPFKFLELYDLPLRTRIIKQFVRFSGNLGKVKYIERNEKEYYIKKQLKSIKNKIYSYPFSLKNKNYLYYSIKEIYRSILRYLKYLDLEKMESYKLVLTNLTKIFLNHLEIIKQQINNDTITYKLSKEFWNDIETFSNKFKKDHDSNLKKKYGFNIFDEKNPNEIMYKNLFEKIGNNIIKERKKNN